MNNNLEFWIIWNPQSLQPPTFKHNDKYSAIREAKRLAQANPNLDFFVLRAIGKARSKITEYIELKEDIPF